MFHIANKVYLEYDYRFHQQYPYIVASSRWNEHPITVSKSHLVSQVSSFEELINNNYEGGVENFWSDMTTKTDKFVVFVDPDTMKKLQFQYWKSIFKDSVTANDLHKLHTSWVESSRLMGYFENIGQWDVGANVWTRANALTEVSLPTLAESQTEFANASVSDVLKSLDKNKVSIEYLIAEFFADSNTPYKTELMNRIKALTWDNWLDELEHLKYEILSGTIDAGKLDNSITVEIGNIESQLAASNILKWTVDPAFNNVEYIRETYDPAIFMECYTKLAEVWEHQYEDMVQLSNLINADQYEALLNHDVARNFGCSYTKARFMTKCNQVFATYCYDKKRKNTTSDLTPFMLRR
jgi:hypothetical protein